MDEERMVTMVWKTKKMDQLPDDAVAYSLR